MLQSDLNDAVAMKTGESLRTIRRRGFSLVMPLSVIDPDEDTEPQVVDWDRLAGERPRAA